MKKLLLALVVLLSACGGGGGGSSTPTPAAVTVAAPSVLVELYGDSLQAGLLNDGTGNVHPPSIAAQATLQQAGRNVRVETLGIGGARMTDLLQGTRLLADHSVVKEQPTWAERMAASTASVVFIDPAVNDANRFQPTPDFVYADQLREAVRTAKTAGKTVVIQIPTPVDPSTPLAGTLDLLLLAQHMDTMRAVAAETGSASCDLYAKATQAGRGMLGDTTDGVHPTAAFNDGFVGPTLAACALPLLK